MSRRGAWALTGAGVVVAVVAVLVNVRSRGGDSDGRVAFSQVEVQAFLERQVARTLPGLDVGAASCPPVMPEQVGGTVTCTVRVERDTLRYDVERLVADRFEARPQHPVVLVRDIASAVQSKLAAPEARVDCDGSAVVQPAPGGRLTCQVTGSGPPRPAAVSVGPDGSITVSDP